MNDELLSKLLFKQVIDDGLDHYAELIQAGDIIKNKRPSAEEWTQALDHLKKLDATTKRQLMIFIRQVSIDTAAHLLGIIDGSSLLEEHREEFRLYYGDDDQAINGDMQTYFLAENESR